MARMLGTHGIDGRDLLPHHYLHRGDAAVVERANDLLHPLWSDENDAAREQHRILIERRLIRWRLSWPDLIAQIQSGSGNAASWHWLLDNTGTALVVTEEVSVSILDQISYVIGQYIGLIPTNSWSPRSGPHIPTSMIATCARPGCPCAGR